ncbi:MAG: hypothetical protein HY300_06385 [Verrucomicrobia bacterium]|nr:hypothetical protein [Verrucomicrobiota bacterium]
MKTIPYFALLFAFAFAAAAQTAKLPAAPKPDSRVEWLDKLRGDAEMKALLDEQIKKLGGHHDAVYAGKEAADPKQDVKDAYHQSLLITPREPVVRADGKDVANLVCYHVYVRNLRDSFDGNYIDILAGKEGPNYSAVALLELPKSDKPEPWLVEARYDSSGDDGGKTQLALGHKQIESAEHGDDTGRTAFVLVPGGKFFIELTRPQADPKKPVRRFWYFRMMKL